MHEEEGKGVLNVRKNVRETRGARGTRGGVREGESEGGTRHASRGEGAGKLLIF